MALWLPGYLYVLCCKLVRVRMHHGPMGRSMDHGDGCGCGCMYGWMEWMDGWVNTYYLGRAGQDRTGQGTEQKGGGRGPCAFPGCSAPRAQGWPQLTHVPLLLGTYPDRKDT